MTGEEENPESSSPGYMGYCSPIDLTADHESYLNGRHPKVFDGFSDFIEVEVTKFKSSRGNSIHAVI
ncbi:MAG TPA: hypothetical protein VMW26_08410 [Methanomassiliicoccales archaeon]|nr:hypothetical protein [Methanomassiliicoccales archaeon]